MSDEPSELDLHAYVDDQLASGQRFALEAYLSENPALAARVMKELSTRTALRLLADETSPAPEAMLRHADMIAAGQPRSFWRKAMPIGGGMALAAALSTFLLTIDDPPDYVDMAVASHRVAMIRANMASQAETPVLDHNEILSRAHIHLPALPANWRVTDVQLFPTSSGPALTVAVMTTDGRALSLFALRQRSDAPEIPDAVREGSESVAYWRRGDMSYALTGEDEPRMLDEVAEGLNRLWS